MFTLDIGGVMNPITAAINKAIVDPNKARELSAMLEKSVMDLQKGQMEVNAVEAAHTSIFVAGWRPFVGWTCGIALAYALVIVPIFSNWFVLAPMQMALLEKILMGMLGLGGARTLEKMVGVARGAVAPRKKKGGFFKNLFKKKKKKKD
jgi:hypothetical protein